MSNESSYFKTFLDYMILNHPLLNLNYQGDIHYLPDDDGNFKIGVNQFNSRHHKKDEYDKLWSIINEYSKRHPQT